MSVSVELKEVSWSASPIKCQIPKAKRASYAGVENPAVSDEADKVNELRKRSLREMYMSRAEEDHEVFIKRAPIMDICQLEYYQYNACSRFVLSVQHSVVVFFKKHNTWLLRVFLIVLGLLYLAYFGYAMYYRFGDEGSLRLLVCTILGLLLVLLNFGSKYVWMVLDDVQTAWSERPHAAQITKWVLYVSALTAIVITLIVIVGRETPENLSSLGGLAVFVVIMYVTSTHPAKVDWHPIFWGLCLQYFFALIILRLEWGFAAFQWLGNRVSEFLANSDEGSEFVFGKHFKDHRFAFAILPTIVFFSTVISVLYYLGVMQAVIRVIGRALAFSLNTTPAESISAAGNIFIGMTETPLIIRPFLPEMTISELHAVMTGGFATIAGSVLAAYISFGVSAQHLISACVMSAPAALAISKLSCPETQKTRASPEDYYRIESGKEKNAIEAASSGASMSIKLIANIAVNVMAFLSLLKATNMTLEWFGDRVGVENLSFQFICSYILYPVAIFMGTQPKDCRKLAELIGIKTFANEFIAYSALSELLHNRVLFDNYTMAYNETSDWFYHNEDIILRHWDNMTLPKGILQPRSEVISTYALCGFANISAIGVMLGALGALAPSQKSVLSRYVVRAMIAGNVACFMTACMAGLLYKPL